MRKIFFALLLLASLPCAAQFKTGNDLYSKLQATGPDLTSAIFYLQGVVDASSYHHDIQEYLRPPSTLASYRMFCAPAGSTAGQIVDIVRTYLRDHPEDRHINAAILVSTALYRVWPCTDSPK